MNIAGLFSGIGGLELPFHRLGASTTVLCDIWEPSRAVLATHFPEADIHDDISTLKSLPRDVDVVTAGFPCTDLSQAGRTAGISGKESGLVAHVFRLLAKRNVEWLVLENVRNMLVLDKGHAMFYLVTKLEELGFRWAYRLVDSRFSGVPQRRHRVLLVASRHHDPRAVLFADEAASEGCDATTATGRHHQPIDGVLRTEAYGFYWTEGYTGLGWAQDAVPPLKGGSTVGIPSPPGIWLPDAPRGRRLVTPTIEDAEALQGFERGWTESAQNGSRNGPRWKLVGNAVSVGVASWLAGRLCQPGDVVIDSIKLRDVRRWPDAAFGEKGKVWQFQASHWPITAPYRHLSEVVTMEHAQPLSHRAAAGFLARASRSQLRFNPVFLQDVVDHVEFTRPRDAVSLEHLEPQLALAI